nr:Hpt domain-containing protein [Leptolyngbyaceae cyanobacterium MAG.088]
MGPEQQQRILGYFIEEAKDHLNTIEQGLLNLQATISNPEMANEVFRAAHSVKGGAAMLGIESMQRTSHRMEDYFKLLKESTLQVDRSLESMFLQVFDALQELLEELQGPFGLTEDKEQRIMAGVEPVFQQLQEHLDHLVATAAPHEQPKETTAAPVSSAAPSPQLVEESALKLVFSSDVSASLREMLARFKQADTDDSRSALEDCCRSFERFGEQFNLPTWMNLVKYGRWAVCDRNNDYRTLAPVLIKEIKKAQDLVLAGREPEIVISETLKTLAAQGDVPDTTPESLDDLFANNEPTTTSAIEPDNLLSSFEDVQAESVEATVNSAENISIDDLLNDAATSPSGPDVGDAELTSLADLFETGGDALDSDWQEEEIPINEGTSPTESIEIDIAPDFDDLLNDDASSLETTSNDFESGNELADLFGDTDNLDADTANSFETLENPESA